MDGSPADDSVILYTSAQCRGWTVASAASPDRHVRARCANARCGRVAIFDAAAWAAGAGPLQRLYMLEERMRCIACGGRSARFEIWSGPQPPPGPGAGLAVYPFR